MGYLLKCKPFPIFLFRYSFVTEYEQLAHVNVPNWIIREDFIICPAGSFLKVYVNIIKLIFLLEKPRIFFYKRDVG